MGYVELYNYITQQTAAVPFARMNAADMQSLEPGTYHVAESDFVVTRRSTGNSPYINIDCSGFAWELEDIPYILEAIGLRNESLLNAAVAYENFKFGLNNDYTSAPYYQQTLGSDNYADVSIVPGAGYTGFTFGYANTSGATYRRGFATPIYIPISDDEGSIGLFCCESLHYYPTASTSISIYYYPSITTRNYSESSGEKGFRPTSARTRPDRPGIGGRGSSNKKDPDYAGDTITLPGAPDESAASAVGCGFVNCYKIDTANLEKVGQCLYGSTLLGLIQSLSINPLDFIISLMIFPDTPNVGSSEHIKLGGWVAAATGGAALGFDASGSRLSSQFKTVSFGSVSIPENWGNFLDYSQTNIELYLPFVGSVSIDVSECMGGTIEVEYTIDFFTGMCVANVLCTRSNYVLPSGKALTNVHAEHAYQGNCAIQIPLSAVNYGSMVGSLINACTQGITNPVAGFTGIVTDAISGGLRPNVSSKGNIVANAGFCSVLYPYVRITRPITAEPGSYQEVMGYPSYINDTLGQCDGLCICDGINLQNVSGATDNELNRIKQLCTEGVYV